jgi:predicted phage terminase large subunit-like protein
LASYGADLATYHSRGARNILMSEGFRAIFGDLATVDQPVTISEDSQSVQAWDLAGPHRGGMVAAGVGGAITGKGAHLLIIDDPVKNREEADNQKARDRIWDWWISTAYTRLEDGAAIIGMLTRWHADDWMGRLLREMLEMGKDQYEVIWLPALWEFEGKNSIKTENHLTGSKDTKILIQNRTEKLASGVWWEEKDLLGRNTGEALWPEKYSAEDLKRIKANEGDYEWSAQYQQLPYSREGTLFKREWFVTIEKITEKIVRRVRYWDKAATEGGGAYTAGVCMSQGESGTIYVEHVARGQWSTDQREEEIKKTALLDKFFRTTPTVVVWHFQDPGSAGKDSAKATNINLSKAGIEAHFEVVSGSKEVRAGPWSSALEAGKVRLLVGGWNEPYIEEHVAFPKGRYKDQVDGSSGAYARLIKSGISGRMFY